MTTDCVQRARTKWKLKRYRVDKIETNCLFRPSVLAMQREYCATRGAFIEAR